MKLAEHAENIRQLIDKSLRNRLGRMGITGKWEVRSEKWEVGSEQARIEEILLTLKKETESEESAYEKLVEEFTFTLFNRLAALKVMEAHTLHPEIVTRRSQHGDRSFAHFLWLEQNPDGRDEEQEGLVRFIEDQLAALSSDIPLFSLKHPYHLLPTAIELNGIINAFNQVETDAQVENDIWRSDDVLGWLYESYNNYKKAAHKESGAKTEYNKVSIQSQVYTPRWVVKFLVDNSLGKLYLEMFPDSEIKEKYKIANAPKTQIRERKPLTEIRLIDPATGSGNFLLYAFDLFHDLYQDQIDNYGADYNENKISELIICHNLHGVDLDDRAVQLAQLGLYIKAKRKKRSAKIEHFNIVSSDFFLPDYEEVKHLFENGEKLSPELEKIVIDIWADLQQAYKFGSLIRLEEKFNSRLKELEGEFEKPQLNFLAEPTISHYKNFRKTFFDSLHEAVAHNTERQGLTFLNSKTSDAITFLHLLTQKYDVAVANPPYTDSSDFGTELKKFIDDNYKKPFKFHINLYATFIKRCYELIDEKGKMALVHPLTFMYISSFEDVRKFALNNLHINIVVDYGLSNQVFGGPAVNPALYILEKGIKDGDSYFIKLNDLSEGKRRKAFLKAYEDLIVNRPNKHNYTLHQSKLKIIEGWPFIYWISDGFREKFKKNALKNYASVNSGINTGNNNKYIRFNWEINNEKKWIGYSKGGSYCKWFGNLWLKVDWENEGKKIKEEKGSVLRNKDSFFKKGMTYSGSGSKGVSFRYLPINYICDMGGSSVTPLEEFKNINYLLAFANSKLIFYIIDCLNPTVNTQVGDLERIPFVNPSKELEQIISVLASQCIDIKKHLCSYHVIETNFTKSSLAAFTEASLRDRLLTYLNYENAQLTQVLLNEAIINELIFEVYDLSPEDREQVEAKMGKPVGELPVLAEARDAFIQERTLMTQILCNADFRGLTQGLKKNIYNNSNPSKSAMLASVLSACQSSSSSPSDNNGLKKISENQRYEISALSASQSFDEQQIQTIKAEFTTLYQSNNDLEEFCIRHQVNPINVWYWFRESKILPQARASEIALEFLADAFRSILMEDQDGIIPLVGLPGEPRLLDRLEQHCLNNGFTSAQFMQLDGLLGRPINEYIEHHFFDDFSNLLNLFRHLPKTPFIWHLSSGIQQGFEAYIIIYKWNTDSLYKLKTQYLSKRAESLEYRQIQLVDSSTAQAQNEKETIRLQLQEISGFTKKIDELIAEGYYPKLDDGVGKNIAPLQNKGLLRSEVLNKKQLEKYLKADW